MEYFLICIALFAVLVFLDIVPHFKKLEKKTFIFTVVVFGVSLIFLALIAFDTGIKGPTDMIEKAIGAIFKV